jgi:ankyrin repeat protein
MIKLLIDMGFNVNSTDNHNQSTPLIVASMYTKHNGCDDIVIMLLNYGANLEIKNRFGNTALLCVAKMVNTTANLSTLKLLIDSGADINSQNAKGDTALIRAVKFNHIDAVQMLLVNGADFNKTNLMRATAYDVAKQQPMTSDRIKIKGLLKEHIIRVSRFTNTV